MKGATLFSGIGAPEAAATWIDWRWSADIDAFANAVRAHHWPEVPNLGDVSKLDGGNIEPIDILVFGSPCQSFSIAGKRLGLDDPRGNLALVALALVSHLRPRWFVFENVPGLRSNFSGSEQAASKVRSGPVGGRAEADEERDLAAFLAEVRECGYSGAWASLDAQYFNVPQRRERIFFVGHLGDDWRPSAAILFESESLSGHPPPRREARPPVAALTSNGVGTCGADDNQAQAGHLIASTGDTAHCLNAGGMGPQDYETETLVAFQSKASASQSMNPALVTPALDVGKCDGPAVAMNLRGREDGAMPEIDDVASLRAADGGSSRSYVAVTGDTTHALDSANNGKMSSEDGTGRGVPIIGGSTVRPLIPTECERLMGFKDGFTDIPWRGKRAPDSRRYKALGNSMAVPVIGWILDRIRLFEATP